MTPAQQNTVRVLISEGWKLVGYTTGIDGRDTKRVLVYPPAGSESSTGEVKLNGNLHHYFYDPVRGYQVRRITRWDQFEGTGCHYCDEAQSDCGGHQ